MHEMQMHAIIPVVHTCGARGRWRACRFNAEIDFDGPKLLERYMARQDVGHMKAHFARAVAEEDNDDFEVLMKAYGTEVVSLVGSEVCAGPHPSPVQPPPLLRAHLHALPHGPVTGFSGCFPVRRLLYHTTFCNVHKTTFMSKRPAMAA